MNKMNTIKNNENLVNNDNQPQQEPMLNEFQKQVLVNKIDELLLERIPYYIEDELEWIGEEFGDTKISEFLCGDDYYSESPLLRKLGLLYNE